MTVSHILLVEDNAEVGVVLGDMLTLYGHTSILTHNGQEAFAALDKGGIEAVVTDMRLPGSISGEAIADRAEAMGIGRVLITGYGDVMSKLREKRDCIWLLKPFRAAQLASAVAAALQPPSE